MTRYVDVLLPLPLSEVFTYIVPPPLTKKIQPGMRVLVPFRGRLLTGFVVQIVTKTRKTNLLLKPIAELLDEKPFVPRAFLFFVEKLSRYFFLPWGEILQAAVPPPFLVGTKTRYSLSPKGVEALNRDILPPTEAAIARVLKGKAYSLRYLKRKVGEKNIVSLLARMEKKEWISIQKETKLIKRKKKKTSLSVPAQLELDFSFDENLRQASRRLSQTLALNQFSPFLVFGPRLKRQALYLELIRQVRLGSRKALYLVPEIALASDVAQKIQRQLGEEFALFHSQLSAAQREVEWQRVREKQVGVVLGPRSALFAPLEDVRLIILDEEQDDSYDQREGSSFDVRRGAWLRAREEKATLVLGSAAPTVEAYFRAKKGNYLIDLGSEEFRKKVVLVDGRKDLSVLSRVLLEKIEERLATKQPVILFFNRRGYAAYLLCSKCRHIPRCPRCKQVLSYHKKEEKLVCHSCRIIAARPAACPRCGSRLLERRGPGIEAVAEELRRTFPQGRVEVFAADEASRKKEREALLARFKEGKIDVLLATRFLTHQAGPLPVSLVGILHPETLLHLADFKSSQRAFLRVTEFLSFLNSDPHAEAVIQTAAPEHFAIRAAACGDYRAFYEQEIKFRRLMEYPPFSCLAEVIFEGQNPRQVAGITRELVSRIRESGVGVEVFGPSLASSAGSRRSGRIRMGLKARKKKCLDSLLSPFWREIRLKKSIFFFD